MTKEELKNWRCQFGTSNVDDKMGLRYVPMVFTEHGIVMLSSILRSSKAIEINIMIIKVFNQMRKILSTNQKLFTKIESLEKQILENNESIQEIRFEIKKMIVDEKVNERKIGFRVDGM